MPFCMPIACSKQIDSLDRRQNNLTEVPHEVDRYRGLEELLLSMNHIKSMPKSLFRLHKLKLLDMSDNDLNDLPPEIQNLINLVELNLKGNEISNVPEQLRMCKALTSFDISNNPITRLPESIAQCTSLCHLGLNDVSLTQLPSEIGRLCNLRSLECRENLIRVLPLSLTELTKLQVLDLGQNDIEQLPTDIGNLEALRELYVDQNSLDKLPDGVTRCQRLEQIDMSDNNLKELPEDFGALEYLTDVNFSDNELKFLPESFGRLRRLNICKLERNDLAELTPTIGQCEQMTELLLTENFLTSIPPSIGNLRHLKNLNLDKNHLTTVPPTIGGCISLSILSLRENQITDLPMDIGKCENLTVLDLCNNRLKFLPFTFNVLFKLQALWLSENQSQALIKLQEVRDPRTNVKVLTCYLLPQQGVQPIDTEPKRRIGAAFLDGPKVHFPDQDSTIDEDQLPTGQFERHDTPKPKTHKEKFKKNSIDGHVIPHTGPHPDTLALNRKITPETSHDPFPAPRSALKYHNNQPQHQPNQYEHEVPIQRTSQPAPAENHVNVPSPVPGPSNARNTPPKDREVVFAADVVDEAPSTFRLKRIDTPHYKGVRGALPADRSRIPRYVSSGESAVRTIVIRREHDGLGLSIAGGVNSTPYVDGDSGLFVSRVNPGQAADRAGLKVGDKMLSVNNVDVQNVSHDAAVQAMKEAGSEVRLTVLRTTEPQSASSTPIKSPEHTLDMSFMSDAIEVSSLTKETIGATLKRDSTGSPGFTIAGGVGSGQDGIFISSITPGGAAERHGNIRVGDRVLSINGTKLKSVRHDQAVLLLTGHPQDDLLLVIQREKSSYLPSTPVITSGPPSLAANSTVNSTMNTTAQSPVPVVSSPTSASVPIGHLGDTSSWDGKTEDVELRRDGKSLGLSIVGGIDHSSHPFGIDNPGVFISKITAGSPAARSRRLRVGDRILAVNNIDVSQGEHRQAVDALKSSGPVVKLRVTHDPQPSGLREVVVRRVARQPLGIAIHGGVGKPPANKNDSTDEGIFIERVDPNSISEAAGLIKGLRLIEVNGESLMGCKQHEAADLLKAADELRLLVCDGYNQPSLPKTKTPSTPSVYSSGVDENGPSLASPETSPLPPASSVSPPPSIPTNGISLSSTPLNRSVVSESSIPVPTSTPEVKKPSKIPPPVAPKPTLRLSQAQNITTTTVEQPELLGFASKLQKFQKEIEVRTLESRQTSTTSLPPPEKRSLLSEEDIRKLKESESRKVFSTSLSPEKDSDNDFMDDLSELEHAPRGPMVIRTKKAENRAIAAGIITPNDSLDEQERSELERQKSREWRAARLKSLEQEKAFSDELMNKANLAINNLDSISEEHRHQIDVDVTVGEIGFADD